MFLGPEKCVQMGVVEVTQGHALTHLEKKTNIQNKQELGK